MPMNPNTGYSVLEIPLTGTSPNNPDPFPTSLVKEIFFSSLYIFAAFVKDKVSIGAWIYLWAFYFVPLIYISVFVPVLYCLDDCGFVVEPEVRQVDSSSCVLFSQDCFGRGEHRQNTLRHKSQQDPL